MTKTIKFSNGIEKEMTFEEVVKKFTPLMNRTANIALGKIVYNAPEKEDVMQELRYELWEAYKRYDGRAAFITYATYRLKLAINKIITPLFAQKRTNTYGQISANEMLENGDGEVELIDTLGVVDEELLSADFRALIVELEKNLDSTEKLMLQTLISKKDFSVVELSKKLNMSRQGANKKLNKFKIKMAKLLQDSQYYVVAN
jgi:RNA polymerase sigma factor (sigma-70 family)